MGIIVWLLARVIRLMLTVKEKAKVKKQELEDKLSDSEKDAPSKLGERSASEQEGASDSEPPVEESKGKGVLRVILRLLEFISLVHVTVELAVLVLILLMVFIMALVVMAIVLIVISFTTPSTPAEDPAKTIDGYASAFVASGDALQFTEEELAAGGALLTPHEKNIYRMGILARKATLGYGGTPLGMPSGATSEFSTLVIMGIASTENGMRFYEGNADNKNLLKDPSNLSSNGKGYGFFGLHSSDTLNTYFKDPVLSRVRSEYTPSTQPAYVRDFAPWGVTMGAAHINSKLTLAERKDVLEMIEKKMDDWGVVHDKDEVRMLLKHELAQAAYHGTTVSDEFPLIIDYTLAVRDMTGDKDEDRSIGKIEYITGGDYSESGARKAILGNATINNISGVSSASSLTLPSGATKIVINGVQLDKPLLRVVVEKYGTRGSLTGLWSFVKQRSAQGGSMSARILNLHYGLNSYLMGKHIEGVLRSKMVGLTETAKPVSNYGTFKTTPGKAQASVDGLDPGVFIDKWYASTNASNKKFVDGLRPMFGTSAYMDNGNKMKNGTEYKDTLWGVPFYGQGSRYGDVYGTMRWHWGQSDTFNQSGCMVYSMAYVASAFTGTLINPAEFAVIMTAKGSLISQGVSVPNMVGTYKSLGLKATYLDSGRNSMDQIYKAVTNGGMAVVRFSGPPYASGSNHFVALNGVKIVNGKRMYSIYSSTNESQSMALHSEETLKQTMWKNAIIVTK